MEWERSRPKGFLRGALYYQRATTQVLSCRHGKADEEPSIMSVIVTVITKLVIHPERVPIAMTYSYLSVPIGLRICILSDFLVRLSLHDSKHWPHWYLITNNGLGPT